MTHTTRVALGTLVLLLTKCASLPARADDRPTADVMKSLRPNHPQMFWFAKAFSRPDYAEHEIRYIGDRAGIFHLLWAAGLPAVLPEKALSLDGFFRGIDVAFFRSAWNEKDAIFVGFKGGDNRANHSHLDLGTFVLDALGERSGPALTK